MPPFWKTCVLEALRHFDGEADLMDIYKWLESMDWLGERDLEESPYQGRSNYQHSIRSVVAQMVKRGELAWVSRGRYRLLESTA